MALLFDVAVAAGYVEDATNTPLLDRIDHVVAVLFKLSQRHGR